MQPFSRITPYPFADFGASTSPQPSPQALTLVRPCRRRMPPALAQLSKSGRRSGHDEAGGGEQVEAWGGLHKAAQQGILRLTAFDLAAYDAHRAPGHCGSDPLAPRRPCARRRTPLETAS